LRNKFINNYQLYHYEKGVSQIDKTIDTMTEQLKTDGVTKQIKILIKNYYSFALLESLFKNSKS